MPTGQKSRSKDALVQNPAQVGNALAHVITIEAGREMILGQAWIAAPGRLITCGHVVERYVNAASLIYLRFPASGNKYQVARIRLHPSFVRQPDQLVKFDVALLEVLLQLPESSASPLPFSYEQTFTQNQILWAIRYPAHLGHLSAAPQPLTQDGKYLGPLRIHDTFHLLHDLPLAPGDSGAPITDGNGIVAIHCGDTATLPGLNLPTTSIRLALWVDALRELGISETTHGSLESRRSYLIPSIIAFVLTALIAAFGGWTYYSEQAKKGWQFEGGNPALMPVRVAFNEPIDGYVSGHDVMITITPYSNCFIAVYDINTQGVVHILYPQKSQSKKMVNHGEQRIIGYLAANKLTASEEKSQTMVVWIDGDEAKGQELYNQLLLDSDWSPGAQEAAPLTVSGEDLIKRVKGIQEANKGMIQFAAMIGPYASTK